MSFQSVLETIVPTTLHARMEVYVAVDAHYECQLSIMLVSIKGPDLVSMLLELRLMTLVQNQQYINAIYYAQRYIREFNNIFSDVTLMAIFHVISNRVVANKHIEVCLQLYKQIPPTLYSQRKIRKQMAQLPFFAK